MTAAGFEITVPEGMEEMNQVVNRLTQMRDRDSAIEAEQVEVEA